MVVHKKEIKSKKINPPASRCIRTVLHYHDCSSGDSLSKYQKQKNKYGGLHTVWCGMRQRCYNKDDCSYRNYGGKGIKVCYEWRCFKGFYAWAKYRHKPGLVLDRIDGSGDYSPKNCQFITQKENIRKSSFVRLNVGSVKEIKCLIIMGMKDQQIGDIYGVARPTIHSIRSGQTWKDVNV